MKFLLGKKVNMSQIFDEDGNVHPATILSVPTNVITGLRFKEKHSYNAVQLGFGEQKAKRVLKAQKGVIDKLEGEQYTADMYPFGLREFRLSDEVDVAGKFSINSKLTVNEFAVGDKVSVSAISKGKGFQGVVKRHNFAGGPRSHGQKHSEREPGSIGATGPQRVFKGTKMAGRMGGEKITVKNLKVLAIDEKTNEVVIRGAVPGRRGTLIAIRKIA